MRATYLSLSFVSSRKLVGREVLVAGLTLSASAMGCAATQLGEADDGDFFATAYSSGGSISATGVDETSVGVDSATGESSSGTTRGGSSTSATGGSSTSRGTSGSGTASSTTMGMTTGGATATGTSTGGTATGTTTMSTGTTGMRPSVCGNGVIEAGEDCDVGNLGERTCALVGDFAGGVLRCHTGQGGTCKFDTSACIAPTCSDGKAEGKEVCDGSDFRGKTCAMQTNGALPTGSLTCTKNCTDVDASSCGPPVCGDAIAHAPEVCDASDLKGATCGTETAGERPAGVLRCSADCTGYNTSGCKVPVCGNGELEPGEACDGSLLGGKKCSDTPGLGGKGLGCAADCKSFDTSMCCPRGGGYSCINSSCNCQGGGDACCAEACFAHNVSSAKCNGLACAEYDDCTAGN